jgi:hypothetical protein
MKGQTLIEALAALGIIAIVVSSIAVSVIVSLNNSQFNKSTTLAAEYSQEGMEIIRKIRNDDYAGFSGYNGLYCLGKGQTTLGNAVSSCSKNLDSFIRSIQIEQSPGCGVSIAKVSVIVAWNDGKCQSASVYCHKELDTTCMSILNPIKTL